MKNTRSCEKHTLEYWTGRSSHETRMMIMMMSQINKQKKIFAFAEETISVWRRHTQINLLLTWWDPPFLCSRQMRPNRWLCRWEQLHVVSAFRDSTRGPSETRNKISISKTAQSSPSSCWSWAKEIGEVSKYGGKLQRCGGDFCYSRAFLVLVFWDNHTSNHKCKTYNNNLHTN